MQKRLMICSVVVAVVGLLGAVLIYVTAGDDDADENVQVVIVEGKTYKIPLDSTKLYRRDLQRAGGDAMVLFDDIIRGFSSLWHGKSLAITMAAITVLVSGGLFLAARSMGADSDFENSQPVQRRPPAPPGSSS